MMEIIKTPAELETALEASQEKPIVIFKHSASCPFSAMAQFEVANAKHDLDIYALVVQYVPELSKSVAEELDVEHQSPQAIIVHKRAAKGHFWRSEIKEIKLKQVIEELKSK
ncbi:general stress protein [Lewinellaceae bacterium SD302]|nr:general stress protein [Lewinellaceae bacterium SD302]